MNNPANDSALLQRTFTGRRKILLDYETVDVSNIFEVLQKAINIHEKNRDEIDYLYKYYKGDQPILYKHKLYREEINHKVLSNHANEIVSFKDGYFIGEPVQYVSVGEVTDLDPLNTLNDWMRDCDKASVDQEIVNWFHICGTAYRITNSRKDPGREHKEAPFYTYCLDPRDTFVVYSSHVIGEPAIMCVKYRALEDGTFVYSCYTPREYFEIVGNFPKASIVKRETNYLFDLPIVEYPLNNARLGSFEICLTLLDALNALDSDRTDAVSQFVESIMLFHNVDVDDDVLRKVKELGALAYADVDPNRKGDVKYITAELNQTQTQTLANHLYDTILTICGMPNRNMNATSTSDTGASVVLRNGWSDAEARAKDTELMFRKSEKQFLRLVLKISNEIDPLGLSLTDIAVRFTRRSYENIATKANVLSALMGKIPPLTAYTASGMFVDPQAEYEEYRRWKAENAEEGNAVSKENATGTKEIQSE